MKDDLETRRKRLIYRSSYTGMKETDLLLGKFARQHLPHFDSVQLDWYEALLQKASDPEIYAWATGKSAVPKAFENDVMTLLCNFKIDKE